MSIYIISYDLNKPDQNYTRLHQEIKRLGDWWHYLDSTWLVDSSLNSSQIWNQLKSAIDKNDSLLIVKITNDYTGWLPKKAWEWINSHIKYAA